MVHQCIQCKEKWADYPEETLNTKEISHGYCGICGKRVLTPIIRKKQLKEGNFDCFGKSKGYCDQEICKYRECCL